MKHKVALTSGLIVAVLLCVTVIYSQSGRSAATQKQQLATLKQQLDSGAITEQQYEAKVAAINVGTQKPWTSTAPAQGGKLSWSRTRQIEVLDPVFKMSAYTVDVPEGWSFAGIVARPQGCKASHPNAKFTEVSPDGQAAVIAMPGMAWSWIADPNFQRQAAAQGCPMFNVQTAADFLTKIAVPTLRPNARVVAVLPADAATQAKVEKQRDTMAEMNREHGTQMPYWHNDGSRVRLQYEINGHPVEEQMEATISCNQNPLPTLPRQPAQWVLKCESAGEIVIRTMEGHLDGFLAQPQLASLLQSLKGDPAWQQQLTQAEVTASRENGERFIAASNAAFNASQARFNQQMETMRSNARAQNDQVLAGARQNSAENMAKINAMGDGAHQMVNFVSDQREFTNPDTGQVVQMDSQATHPWINSSGNGVVLNADPTYDPNGAVQPGRESWTELVPRY